MLRAYLLEHIADYGIYVAAGAASTHPTPELDVNTLFSSEQDLANGFLALGYAIEHDCKWRLLGLAKDEGPEPSLDLIKRRAQMALSILETASTFPWAVGNQHIHTASIRIGQAETHCVQELELVLARRTRNHVTFWPRWLELEPEFLQHAPPILNTNRDAFYITNLSTVIPMQPKPEIGRAHV